MNYIQRIYDLLTEARASAHWKTGKTPAEDEIIVQSLDKHGIKKTIPAKAGTKRFTGARTAFPTMARGGSGYRESR